MDYKSSQHVMDHKRGPLLVCTGGVILGWLFFLVQQFSQSRLLFSQRNFFATDRHLGKSVSSQNI